MCLSAWELKSEYRILEVIQREKVRNSGWNCRENRVDVGKFVLLFENFQRKFEGSIGSKFQNWIQWTVCDSSSLFFECCLFEFVPAFQFSLTRTYPLMHIIWLQSALYFPFLSRCHILCLYLHSIVVVNEFIYIMAPPKKTKRSCCCWSSNFQLWNTANFMRTYEWIKRKISIDVSTIQNPAQRCLSGTKWSAITQISGFSHEFYG